MSSNRIPNLLHFVILLGIAFFTVLTCQTLAPHSVAAVLPLVCGEMITLVIASFLFPLLWQRPFLDGLHWKFAKASPRLALLGLALGFAAQGVNTLIPHPKDLPIEEAFRNPGTIWMMAIFGIFIGPVFEEVLFRGFLLPGIANAFDYARIAPDSDPAVALERLAAWQQSRDYSRPALVVASVVTSLLFGLLHAQQLDFTWSAMAMLASVSIVLCWVRLRTDSVAASATVHVCYNLSIFLTLFIGTGGFRHLEAV